MYKTICIFCSLLLAVPVLAVGEEPKLAPFPIDWRTETSSAVDLSFLLAAPAGKDGFVRIEDGHLAEGNGRRLRIWGVNVSSAAAMPSKQSASLVAARLARLGVNGVRFHFFDRTAPCGIIDSTRDDTRALDAEQLDRLDFLVAELKKRGIYTNLNLNVARIYKAGDGVRDHELLGFAKALTYFDRRLIELQKEYARALLTHRNPYTGNEYRDEPAVAIVELVNENSLVEAWVNNRLLGKNTTKNPGTWTDIPASYEQELTRRYNAWLSERLSAEQLAEFATAAGVSPGEPIPRLRREDLAAAPQTRLLTEATFYMEIERHYFEDMMRYLRRELGLKSLLVGSADHAHHRTGYPHVAATSLLDVVDGHVYWQHPNYTRDPKTRRTTGFRIGNSPMVDDPLHSTVVQLARTAVAGKPYTVSEVNHPFPSEFACEGIPILAAYSALQDWDGIFWYTLAHRDPAVYENRIAGHFDLLMDPVKMSQLAAGALIFLRGDVQAARQTIGRSYSRGQVIDSIRLDWSESPMFTPGFSPAIPLLHATRIDSLDGPPSGPFESPSVDPIRSDTGELVWHHKEKGRGLVTIETARSQALIGFCGGSDRRLENLAVRTGVAFCAITLGSLDGKPIATSDRLLLTTAARVANAGMRFDPDRHTLEDWGRSEVCIEPVTGTVTLCNLTGAKALTAQLLDGTGRPLGPPIPATEADGGWSIPTGSPPTTWYLISVSR